MENLKTIFICLLGEIATHLWLNRMVGQIYGLLYLSPKPVSLETIVNKLMISKASASLNVWELEKWEAVRKIWVPGSRKDFYQANSNFVNIIYTRGRLIIRKILDNLNENLARMPKNFFGKSHLSEIRRISDFCNLAKNLLNILPEEISLKKSEEISGTLNKVAFLLKK